jgi:hypothetical protein
MCREFVTLYLHVKRNRNTVKSYPVKIRIDHDGVDMLLNCSLTILLFILRKTKRDVTVFCDTVTVVEPNCFTVNRLKIFKLCNGFVCANDRSTPYLG